MAPFNKRQIGYIQAIAGRQQHRTLLADSFDRRLTSENASVLNAGDHQLMPQGIMYVGDNGVDSQADKNGNSTGALVNRKSLLIQNYHLDTPELGFDTRAVHNNDKLESQDFTSLLGVHHGMGALKSLEVFRAPVTGFFDWKAYSASDVKDATGDVVANPDTIPSNVRATPDGFLNSTTLKFRFTLPTVNTNMSGTNPMGQDHYEFRWIVWRSKRPTFNYYADYDDTRIQQGQPTESAELNRSTNMDAIRNGCSFRNPAYDFFLGQTGRKRGLLGYTLNADLDKDKFTVDGATGAPTERYSGKRYVGSAQTTGYVADGPHTAMFPIGEDHLTVDDLMTMRINKDDYVVMKDVRFFLGKEHGKSHFEDTLHWDWNDPIDTANNNVLSSPTLNDKNYRWHITLFGTTGGPSPVLLNESVRWTTKMESG